MYRFPFHLWEGGPFIVFEETVHFPACYFGGCIHSVDTTLCNPYKLSVGSTGLNQYLGLFLAIYGNFHLFLST